MRQVRVEKLSSFPERPGKPEWIGGSRLGTLPVTGVRINRLLLEERKERAEAGDSELQVGSFAKRAYFKRAPGRDPQRADGRFPVACRFIVHRDLPRHGCLAAAEHCA